MEITLRHLEIFVEVAKQKSILKASENLYLSQSAVSMALSEFEKRLGIKLFDRVGRKLILNNYGEKIFAEATAIIERVENIENKFKNSEFSGKLIIGATQTIGNYALPEIIWNFKNTYRDVNISMIIENTEKILDKLLNFEIDIAFIEGIINHQEIKAIKWIKDEIVIFAGKNNPISKKEKVTIKDLENSKWVLREKGSGTRDIFEKVISKKIKNLNICMEANQIEAIKNIVACGNCIGALSIISIKKEVELKKLVVLNVPFKIKRDFKIFIHKKKYITPILEHFIENVKKIC